MKDAETTFSTKVRSVGLRKPTAGVTVYSNVTGKPYPGDNSRAVNLLATQMTSSVQFVKQVENMYNDGARVFVEFGPRKTLTKLVGQILEGKPDVVTIAVNPGKPGDNSDLLMREAAAQMAVAGVTLDQFDPWGTPNPFRKKSQVKKKRKTSLRSICCHICLKAHQKDATKDYRRAIHAKNCQRPCQQPAIGSRQGKIKTKRH